VERKLRATLSGERGTLAGTFRIAQGGIFEGKKVHWVDYSFNATKIP